MLEREASVARYPVAGFDGLASSASKSGSLAVWSERGGTWAATLNGGALKPQRIGERCEGGVAALADGGLWVACARPSSDEARSRVEVLSLSAALQVLHTVEVGRAGRDGRSVALAFANQALFVAWEDGKVGAPSVRLAELPVSELKRSAPRVREQTLSAPGKNGREPALLAFNGAVYASWSESELTAQGETHRVMVARVGSAARAVRTVHAALPTPALAADEQGLVLAFRDGSRDSKPELFVARLHADLSLASKPRRLGRANGEGRPVLALCAGTHAAVAPLEHATELYVAFHPLTQTLNALEDNHQYYANKREFVLASAVCNGPHVSALLAERSAPSKPSAELVKVDFRCAR